MPALSTAVQGRLLALVAYMAVFGGGLALGHWLLDTVSFEVRPGNESHLNRMILVAVLVYTLSLALPFVPGAEIGWGLILLLGPRVVAPVYLCTIVALALSYAAGRRIPAAAMARASELAHLARLRSMILETQALSPQARIDRLTAGAPSRVVPLLLRHRHLALAVALNTPGNSLLGGGGGLALVAGMSGLYRPLPYLLTVALAVSPVPLVVLATALWPP